MIQSFGNALAADLFDDRVSRETRRFDARLRHVARRKLLYLHDAAALGDLRCPPGNRLEALRGSLKGQYSLRINEQWRVTFRWDAGHTFDVAIVDYH